jgi:hypothetical protein
MNPPKRYLAPLKSVWRVLRGPPWRLMVRSNLSPQGKEELELLPQGPEAPAHLEVLLVEDDELVDIRIPQQDLLRGLLDEHREMGIGEGLLDGTDARGHGDDVADPSQPDEEDFPDALQRHRPRLGCLRTRSPRLASPPPSRPPTAARLPTSRYMSAIAKAMITMRTVLYDVARP